jgi:NAD(P)-dependent dehydrogenase (short-subunit alcohol dehydrogenase family)
MEPACRPVRADRPLADLHSIRAAAVAPGSARWPRSPSSSRPAADSAASVRVGVAAVFLASEAASFVTGHLLAVDGGFLASGVNQ